MNAMTTEEIGKVYAAHRDEALALATRKWGYSPDHAEDALQAAVLYLLEHWKKPSIGRSGFIQNVRQQCVNLMGKNQGRSMSRGTPNKMIPVGDWRELADIERHNAMRQGGRKLPKRAGSDGGDWYGGDAR